MSLTVITEERNIANALISGLANTAETPTREQVEEKLAGAMQGTLQQAVYLFAAPLSQAARALGALETKAQADPSIIAGAGQAPAVDQDATEDSSEAPAADAANDAAPAADQAAAAADVDTTDAADAASDK